MYSQQSIVIALALLLACQVHALDLNSVQIQTDAGRAIGVFDVVESGTVSNNWKPAVSPAIVFDVDAPGAQMFILLNPTDEHNHTVDVSGAVVPGKIFEMSIEPPTFLLSPEEIANTVFQFYCVGNGTAVATVTFKFDGTQTVTIAFQKQCLVYSDQLLSGFCSSLADDGVATIVVNGSFQNDWLYFADETKGSDTFFFWTDTLQRPFLKYGLISFFMYDPAVLTPIANPPKGTAYLHVRGLPSSHLNVEYNCNSNGGTSTITMALELNGAFDDVYITWSKTCPVVQPQSGGGGSSWTPVGIFFFTVFIVTLVGCLGGCMYNYLARRKTGLDVIPCINVYRRCFAAMCGGSQHRVPEASSYTAVSDSKYGATSTSAPAYQSAHHNDL